MTIFTNLRTYIYLLLFFLLCVPLCIQAQIDKPAFRVIGFFTAKNDQAHISYVHEANTWLAAAAKQHHFAYDSTQDWNNLNGTFLANYQVVLFLDTRPEEIAQRAAFEAYVKNGGGWIGFHFAGFALTPSAYPQDWDWYHQEFLGAGEYKSNTWRPTKAVLRVEDRTHPAAKGLDATLEAAPNEWYCWKNDLRKNKDMKVLLSVDPSSFPLGTGPKPHEIWHSGDYPVAWTNTKYRMMYINMGHNDIDYEGKTNRTLSSSFGSKDQNTFLINTLMWLGKGKK